MYRLKYLLRSGDRHCDDPTIASTETDVPTEMDGW